MAAFGRELQCGRELQRTCRPRRRPPRAPVRTGRRSPADPPTSTRRLAARCLSTALSAIWLQWIILRMGGKPFRLAWARDSSGSYEPARPRRVCIMRCPCAVPVRARKCARARGISCCVRRRWPEMRVELMKLGEAHNQRHLHHLRVLPLHDPPDRIGRSRRSRRRRRRDRNAVNTQ